MSDTPPIVSKWNARYAYANKDLPEPASVLIKGAAHLPESGVALDLACGRAGNAFYLAERGLSVHAWDISSTAIDWVLDYKEKLAKPISLFAQVRNVVDHPPESHSFDVIVVSRFLDRALCAKLVSALKPNGTLFYQTFTAGLSNPDYLLRPNELQALFADLQQCYASESLVDEHGRSEALFIGRKPSVNGAGLT